jgi:DNA-binding HxlR family transcriptional regulator
MNRDTAEHIRANPGKKGDRIMADRVRIQRWYADGQQEGIRFLYDECSGKEDESVHLAIALIQGKWKIGILSGLQGGSMRLSQLRRKFPEASKKVLTQHLREMERDGLIIRTDLSGRLRHVEYSLSDPGGFAVSELFDALTEWSSRHASSLSRPEPVRTLNGTIDFGLPDRESSSRLVQKVLLGSR